MKKFFKHSLPHISLFKSHPNLNKFFGKLLHDPNLWHLNRHSLAGGMAVGLFVAFVPFPGQMLLAAGLAILFSVNLPLSVSLVWVTNPITIPPAFYLAYKLGAMLLGLPTQAIELDFSPEWVFHTLANIWQPLLLGCFVLGAISALIGYWLVIFLWRLQVTRLWQIRRANRLLKAQKRKLAASLKKNLNSC
ncbi:hypothetical protein PN36_18570 [Candidatus Thiomargarita nelsonii]|uniref:DUF2062 domain-containing protein n=1 Tax=Candidatus Thiomargarita nelsonii TaxID=1003181 RepID=A0A0A6PEZ2_9GAMM|nr:hypothetical protein PN36_18570 [Candidatus Thiomargarita nelsonii]